MKQFYPHINKDNILRQILPEKKIILADGGEMLANDDSHSFDIFDETDIVSQLQKNAAELENIAQCNYTYAICDISFGKETTAFEKPASTDHRGNLDVPLILTYRRRSFELLGKDIRRLLSECTQCVIFAATIGPQIDRIMKKKELESMSDALIFDMCASDAIENLCDDINDELDDYFHSRGLFLTDRFSPGYGDLPVSASVDIARILDASRRIGLTFNNYGLMMPLKSVTAVIGISDKPQPMRIRGCKFCRMSDSCSFKKRGLTCYSID